MDQGRLIDCNTTLKISTMKLIMEMLIVAKKIILTHTADKSLRCWFRWTFSIR